MHPSEKQRIKDKVYDLFRGGAKISSADVYQHYKRGRLGVQKPGNDQPAALGAWLAGRDDERDGIADQRNTFAPPK
jgi:hypothetical protein